MDAEPIGAFVNDNVMVTTAVFAKEDAQQALQLAVDCKLNYLQSNVFRYHDTFPHPEGVPYWPELIPDFDAATIEAMASVGAVICGDPDQVLKQCQMWESAGADQLTFGMSHGTHVEDTLETIRIMGEYVIPKIDTDPVHRTTRFRQAAS